MQVRNGILKDMFKYEDSMGEKVVLPMDINTIDSYAFFQCHKIKQVIVPSSVNRIKKKAFADNEVIESISLSKGLKIIEKESFIGCNKLKSIIIPSSVEFMGYGAFNGCKRLNSVIIEEGLKTLEEAVFFECSNLKKIKLPQSLEIIRDSAFNGCTQLVYLTLPSSLKTLEENSFSNCYKLKKINIPKDIKLINSNMFANCNSLENVIFEGDVKRIKHGAFMSCEQLKRIDLSSVERIGNIAFFDCKNLRTVKFCNELKEIGESCFFDCGLKSIELPSTLEVISNSAFSQCQKLKKVILNEGLKTIKSKAFVSNVSLRNIKIPSSVELVENGAFQYDILDSISIYSDTKIDVQNCISKKVIIINNRTKEERIVDCNKSCEFILSDGVVIVDNINKNLYFYDNDDRWVVINQGVLDEYINNIIVHNRVYKRIYEWYKRGKFTPHYTVMENMPIGEIDNFYLKNNSLRWKQLVELSNARYDEEKQGLFKLAYVLGVFSKNGKDSVRAFNFIKDKIIPNIPLGEYHIRFGELNTYELGYNKDFAKLVYKYGENINFLGLNDNDYFAKAYNNFNKIKEAYPNKVVNTNTKTEMLTPELCINALVKVQYKDVYKGNEVLAKNLGLYGYSQADFLLAQTMYEKAKMISKEEILLDINSDNGNSVVTYEMLDKDNPLGLILGNITNCCQTLNGSGKSCLEHGITSLNSRFMVFKTGHIIVGQSWVWYDEVTKRICLDNIEIPKKVLNSYLKKKEFQKEFLKCLTRVCDGFLEKMNSKGLEVSSITVGKGYNDLKNILSDSFPLISDQSKLSGYDGYSDATNQYVLYNKVRIR